ncbi:MAG TPA: RagB/SusD family nutrient uptake outer membrane protein [Fulvivirga sp.]|nr:RagB/SusD family nutrient uptake outer membrane protein [Fulvivirga sp.]
MKKIITTFILLVVFTSCTDLDLKPATGTTANFTFTDAFAYKQYMGKIYAAYMLTGQDGPAGDPDLALVNDEGFTSYMRAYWKAQQITTDETHLTWTDGGIQDMNTHQWTSENQFVRVLYYRLALIISLSNDFLEQSTAEKIADNGVKEGEVDEILEFRNEVRFLRAMAYWHALDLFRNVPLVTTITSAPPTQATPDQLFTFIETELNEIEGLLPNPRSNEYGRVDKGAVWMLQAKLYLNAEVYIGAPKYTECLTAVNKVISAGYTLNPNYLANFMADNDTSNELIFNFTSDGLNSQTWGGTTFLVHAPILGTMTPEDYGVDAGWSGPRATKVFVNKFADITGATDKRAIFVTAGRSIELPEPNDNASIGGYGVPKYVNKTSTGADGSNATFVDTDWPVFRLADAYLMYAEAVLRGGTGGDLATALTLVNDLRQRAYGNASGNITSGQLTLDFILDERSRELYWEATRRVDLIRFGQFTTSGVWPWKGGTEAGSVTDAKYNIFPIPATDLAANPGLKQNPGY